MHLDPVVSSSPPGPTPRWLLPLLCALMLLLSACGGSGDSSRPPEDRARATVLVYVVGSDLEDEDGLATANFKEMMQVGSSEDVNIILETGGANKEGWRTVKRQKVLKDGMEMLAEVGAQRMTDPANLQKFIEWGVKTYPAESYHLMFWNHGGGPLGGFGIDTNFPNTGTMSMPKLVQALKGAKQATGATFDLIGFDACLMASAEVHPLVLVNGKWVPDASRTIVGFDAGDDDTPQDQWWQLQPATSAELCGARCGFSFGIADYQGAIQ